MRNRHYTDPVASTTSLASHVTRFMRVAYDTRTLECAGFPPYLATCDAVRAYFSGMRRAPVTVVLRKEGGGGKRRPPKRRRRRGRTFVVHFGSADEAADALAFCSGKTIDGHRLRARYVKRRGPGTSGPIAFPGQSDGSAPRPGRRCASTCTGTA